MAPSLSMTRRRAVGPAGCVADRWQQVRDGVQEPLPVTQDDLGTGWLRLGVFGCRVEEGAAAEARLQDALGDGLGDGPYAGRRADGLLARAAAVWGGIRRSA